MISFPLTPKFWKKWSWSQWLGLLLCFTPLLFWLWQDFASHREENWVSIQVGQPQKVARFLSSLGISVKREGRALLVPSSFASKLQEILPSFDLEEREEVRASFFESPWQRRLRWHAALEKRLGRLLSVFPGVRAAYVQLPFSKEGKVEKAAVLLLLEQEKLYLSKEEVEGMAKLVAHSVKGLSPKNVALIARGRVYQIGQGDFSIPKSSWEARLQKGLASLPILSYSLQWRGEKALLLLVIPKEKAKKEFKESLQKLCEHLLFPYTLEKLEILSVETNSPKENFPFSPWTLAFLLPLCFYFAYLLRKKGESSLPSILPETFEDLKGVPRRELKEALQEVDKRTLAMALKVASPEVKQAVFTALSEEDAQWIKEELEQLGPLPLQKVLTAQEEVVQSVLEVKNSL